jgi:hypothetical protein
VGAEWLISKLVEDANEFVRAGEELDLDAAADEKAGSEVLGDSAYGTGELLPW